MRIMTSRLIKKKREREKFVVDLNDLLTHIKNGTNYVLFFFVVCFVCCCWPGLVIDECTDA